MIQRTAIVLALFSLPAGAVLAEAPDVNAALQASGVRGGLVVHLAGGDTAAVDRTIALRAGASYLVHALYANADQVAAARERIAAKGLAGVVAVARLRGKTLPYADNLVSLLVIENPAAVAESEVLRVLAPLGVACVRDGNTWTKTIKPRPVDIDTWTHYMHDASGNAVAHDRQVGDPRHLQWQCGPKWSRHHDHLSSVSAMVATERRVFTILDEGSRLSPQLPSDWKLVARDAFNGVLLWKRPIPTWQTQLWPLKSGPANLPRRLVAVGDSVYTTLGLRASAVALDAATGTTLRTYADTEGAEEFVYKDGVLLVLVNRTVPNYESDLAEDSEQGKSRDRRTTYSEAMKRIWAGVRSKQWTHADRVIRAFDAATGKALWAKKSLVLPLTLAADAEHAYFHDATGIIALDLKSGKQAWMSEPVPVWQGMDGRGLQSWFAPTLVACDGKIFFAGGEKTNMSYMGWGSKDIGQDTMTALSAKTGKKLWTAPDPYSGYNSPEDLFFAAGEIWVGNTAKGGGGSYYAAYDPRTGKEVHKYPPTVKTFWFHHRCYRAKATDKYILCSRTGIELVDLKTGQWSINHWVRGACLYGIMPCNGMIYAPPSPCACYPEALVHGFVALAPKTPTRALPKTIDPADRLEKGPAFAQASAGKPAYNGTAGAGSQIANLKSQISDTSSSWPTYRHDPGRSGATATKVAAKVGPAWQVELGGSLTPPVAAGGMVFLADRDTDTVYALDAADGAKRWTHRAGGRVDSPPTYWAGLVLFGSADGYVTCLRAGDGVLAWRLRAAPVDRRIVAFERVESAWPARGSVLVQPDGKTGRAVATVVAGRSMFLDQGLVLCRLDAATGELLGQKTLDDRNPLDEGTLQDRIRGLNMPVALPDILAGDAEHLYMRSQVMDREGNRAKLGPGGSGTKHLFAPYGFTDDSWFHRVYWIYSDGFAGGVGGFGTGKNVPAGRILSETDDTVFGFGRKPSYYRWGSAIAYHLYAAAKAGPAAAAGGSGGQAGGGPEPAAIYFAKSKSLDPTNKPITIAAWVKPDTPDGTVLVRGAQAVGFALILDGGKPCMLLRANGKTHRARAAKPIGKDWTHIAGVLAKDGTMTVYVDGKPAGQAKGAVPLLNTDPLIPMKVGYDDTNQLLPQPLVPFGGAMDDVMLFHRALSADEIAQLAAGGKQADKVDTAAMVLHLDFTKGRTRDASPGKNNGEYAGPKAATVIGPRGDALVFKQPAGLTPKVAPTRRGKPAATRRRKPRGHVAYRWTRDVDILVRAMAATPKALLLAGPQAVIDEDATFQAYLKDDTAKKLAAMDAAWKGKSGGKYLAVDPATGKTLAECPLPAPPVFDGLIVADGRIYLTLMDGKVMCLSAK